MQVGLHLWSRQAGLQEEPAQASLHRRFRRLGERGKGAQTAGAGAAIDLFGVTAQRFAIDKSGLGPGVQRG